MKKFYTLFKVIILTILALSINEFSKFSYLLRVVLLGVLLIETIFFLYELSNDTKVSELFKNVITSLSSVFVILIFIEGAFMFIPRSHNVGYTLASEYWFWKYWNPINKNGFRDDALVKKKPSILFVGDSFTAGHGLKNIEDRFSDKVEQLSPSYNAINIGKNGLDTKKEYTTMVNFINVHDLKPNKIVLQYFGNDIEGVAKSNGVKFDFSDFTPYKGLGPIAKYIVKGSYLVNYIYWLYPRADGGNYMEFLSEAYTSEVVFAKHEEDLNRFVDYANKHAIELVVVIFPTMQAPEQSKGLYVDKVLSFFEGKNIKTIDVTNLIEDLSPAERVVNSNDGHASILVNERVAKEIIKKINN